MLPTFLPPFLQSHVRQPPFSRPCLPLLLPAHSHCKNQQVCQTERGQTSYPSPIMVFLKSGAPCIAIISKPSDNGWRIISMEMYAVCLCLSQTKLNTHCISCSLEYVLICGAFHSLSVLCLILSLTTKPSFSPFFAPFSFVPLLPKPDLLFTERISQYPSKPRLDLIHIRARRCWCYMCWKTHT